MYRIKIYDTLIYVKFLQLIQHKNTNNKTKHKLSYKIS